MQKTPTALVAWQPPTYHPAVAATLHGQLGFVPWNWMGESHAAEGDELAAITLYPITAETSVRKGRQRVRRKCTQPWPTSYWLTSPVLRTRISKLEAAGMIPLLADELRRRPTLSAALDAQHAGYAARRWARMLPADHELALRSSGWTSALRDSGIGGIPDFASGGGVKCLHLHYATYLATRDSLLGEWTHAALASGLADACDQLCQTRPRGRDGGCLPLRREGPVGAAAVRLLDEVGQRHACKARRKEVDVLSI